MTNLWKNFTYAIMILKFNANGEPEINYVTDVCDKQKTFEFHSIEEIKETDMEIQLFNKSRAVDLMNSMYVNGYQVFIRPWIE